MYLIIIILCLSTLAFAQTEKILEVPYIQHSTPEVATLAMILKYEQMKIREKEIVEAYKNRTDSSWLWEYLQKLDCTVEQGEASIENIKAWLNKEKPVLVHQPFRIVTGYNDEKQEFIVHDPAVEAGQSIKLSYSEFEKQKNFYLVIKESPPGIVLSVIKNIRQQQNYKVKFSTQMHIPNSDPFKTQGDVVWRSPDELFIHYTGTGGIDKKIVSKADKVRIFHPVHEVWVSAEVYGDPYAAKGIQNPDEILTYISQNLEKQVVRLVKKGEETVLSVKLKGKDVASFLKDQGINESSIYWDQSKIEIVIKVDTTKNLLKECTLNATIYHLIDTPAMEIREIKYEGNIEVVGYNQEFKLFELPEKLKEKMGFKNDK